MAARRSASLLPIHSTGAEAWPPGFAYDVDVALLLPPPPSRRSYADVAANRRQAQHRNILPHGNALGAGFVSSSYEG
jgi:hypothetical protein